MTNSKSKTEKVSTEPVQAEKSIAASEDIIGLNEKQQHDIERAKRAQERRRATQSEITSNGIRECPRRKLRRLHAPNSFGTYEERTHQGRTVRVQVAPPEEHVFFTDGTKQTYDRKISEGAVPVIFEGEQVKEGSDVMWSMPHDLHAHDTKVFEKESQARLEASNAKAAASAGVSVEEATVEKGMGD